MAFKTLTDCYADFLSNLGSVPVAQLVQLLPQWLRKADVDRGGRFIAMRLFLGHSFKCSHVYPHSERKSFLTTSSIQIVRYK